MCTTACQYPNVHKLRHSRHHVTTEMSLKYIGKYTGQMNINKMTDIFLNYVNGEAPWHKHSATILPHRYLLATWPQSQCIIRTTMACNTTATSWFYVPNETLQWYEETNTIPKKCNKIEVPPCASTTTDFNVTNNWWRLCVSTSGYLRTPYVIQNNKVSGGFQLTILPSTTWAVATRNTF